jgi:hypothetical protein
MTRIHCAVIFLGGALLAPMAGAEPLEPGDRAQIAEACSSGSELLPIIGDLGKPTGRYALPVRDEQGEVVAAITFSRADLLAIPSCVRAEAAREAPAPRPRQSVQAVALTS